MTPDQSKKLDEVYAFVQSFKKSSTLPRYVQTTLAQRQGSLLGGFGTPNPTTLITSGSFNLPANPSSTLIVVIDGKNYELLVK